MFRIIMILFAITLSGCLPTAFVAGTAAGVVVNDQRTFSKIAQDRNIAHQVKVRIDDNYELKKKSHINVAAFHNIVLMVGQAPTPALKTRAYNLAKTVPNVKRIYNEVSIAAPSSALSRTNDSWMTGKVKTKMLARKGLRSTQIKVVTENSTVYLLGLVSHKQADLAANVARQVTGVQKVVKLFEYL